MKCKHITFILMIPDGSNKAKKTKGVILISSFEKH